MIYSCVYLLLQMFVCPAFGVSLFECACVHVFIPVWVCVGGSLFVCVFFYVCVCVC